MLLFVVMLLHLFYAALLCVYGGISQKFRLNGARLADLLAYGLTVSKGRRKTPTRLKGVALPGVPCKHAPAINTHVCIYIYIYVYIYIIERDIYICIYIYILDIYIMYNVCINTYIYIYMSLYVQKYVPLLRSL